MDSKHTHGAGKPAVRVRDLSGFLKVEDAALLWGGERLERAADAFLEKTFGIDDDDLWAFRPDEAASISLSDLKAEMLRHPKRLLADYLTDDEAVNYLLNLGFDLRDERGQPLRATHAMAPAVEAVARGLCGHLPDPTAASVENFAERIQAEAKAFMQGRRR